MYTICMTKYLMKNYHGAETVLCEKPISLISVINDEFDQNFSPKDYCHTNTMELHLRQRSWSFSSLQRLSTARQPKLKIYLTFPKKYNFITNSEMAIDSTMTENKSSITEKIVLILFYFNLKFLNKVAINANY